MDVKVELELAPTAGFYDAFVLDTSTLDGADILASDRVWVDITADVRGVGIRRGRVKELDEFGIGMCDIRMDDPDRKYDPTNTDSIYYGNVQPMRRVRVVVTVSSTDYPLFTGYIEEWPTDYGRAGATFTLVSIRAVDAFAILAGQELDTIASAHSGDLSGTRITRILDRSEVDFPSDLRSIDAGLTTLGATTLGGNPLTELQKVSRTELGDLFVNVSGVLRFIERWGNSVTAQATLSDDGDAGAVDYEALDQSFGTELLYNRILTAGTTGTTQTASDSASRTAFQTRTLSRTDLLMSSDTVAADYGKWLLQRFKKPELRFREARVAVHHQSDARKADVLGLELADVVTIERTPPGAASQLVRTAVVDGLNWTLVPGGDEVWCAISVSSAERRTPFVLDNATFGVLDDDALGF